MAEATTGLADLVDALLDSGATVAGDVTIGVADVDLAAVSLRALVTGVQAHIDRGGPAPRPRRPQRPLAAAPAALPARIDVDRERSDAGLGRVLVVVAELLHEIVEHQALARLEGGSLTPDQQEQVGRALLAMQQRLGQLRRLFADEVEGKEMRRCRA